MNTTNGKRAEDQNLVRSESSHQVSAAEQARAALSRALAPAIPSHRQPQLADGQAPVPEKRPACPCNCPEALRVLEQFDAEFAAAMIAENGGFRLPDFYSGPRLSDSYDAAVAAWCGLHDQMIRAHGVVEPGGADGVVLERASCRVGPGGMPRVIAAAFMSLTAALAWPSSVPNFEEGTNETVKRRRFKFGDTVPSEAVENLKAAIRKLRLHMAEDHVSNERASELAAPTPAVPQYRPSDREIRYLKVLRREGCRLTTGKIATFEGESAKSIGKDLAGLVRAGLIRSHKQGRRNDAGYEILEPGLRALQGR